MELLFLTAFVTGLVGSMHCAGMCGPIAFALPKHSSTTGHLFVSRLTYNLGRIFTYAVLGAIIGSLGFGLKIAGWQQSISILAGVLILVVTLMKLFLPKILSKLEFNFWGNKWYGKLFRSKHLFSFFLIGAFNGILPCGFVYVALIASLATQSVFYGALFMVLFGLGTFPIMFSISMLGQIVKPSIRQKASALTPVFAIIIALVFIARGMNLGIPYLSPHIDNETQTVKMCCTPK
ncbi:MAG: sulfite exporter TauE/SafE family protein [Bacteroidota bacterium]